MRVREAVGWWWAAGSWKMETSPHWMATILSQALKAAPLRRISSESLAPASGVGGVAGEVEHPAGEDVRELR